MKLIFLISLVIVTTRTWEFPGVLYEDSLASALEAAEFANGIEISSNEDEDYDDDTDEEIDDGDDSSFDPSDYPEELDLRDLGIIHRPIWQGMCGSCAWIAGTQTIEGRIAFVSENYIPYSLQNFMNCAGRPCVGASIYAVSGQVRRDNFIVPENEIPYTRRKCVKEGERKTECYKKCGKKNPNDWTNALDDQFAIVAGIRGAKSVNKTIAALQRGPLTTCFTRSGRPKGEKCRGGCLHANSLIGYNKTHIMAQENYGKFGAWRTPKDSICGRGLIKKAFFPNVLYDYDRANAYFTELEGGVDENQVTFLDKGTHQITVNTTKNWGTAKNRCAFIGSLCKGVVEDSSGAFQLVSDFNGNAAGPKRAFAKSQMVIYLKDEASGQYVGIKPGNGIPETLTLVSNKSEAAPFFTSYGRMIPFEFPSYHLVGNTFKEIVETVREISLDYRINGDKKWSLSNCLIYNEASNQVFDLAPGERKKTKTLAFGKMDKTSSSQRFSVGISGFWKLHSDELDMILGSKGKKGKKVRLFAKEGVNFRWQARHIMHANGYSIETNPENPQEFQYRDFDIEKTQNVMRPVDCALGMQLSSSDKPDGELLYLNIENDDLVMSQEKGGWTFEYADFKGTIRLSVNLGVLFI